ncbi:MAG: restriction endonuclease subunit S [Lacrimispora saccharolytica]
MPYEIPENWGWCYLGNIAFVTKLAGFEYTKYIAPNLTNKGIPLLKGKNVQNGKLVLNFEGYIPEELSDELPRSQITKKCLLTPYVGTIGNIAIFDGSFKAHLGSNVGKIELINPSNFTCVFEEYVLYYLSSVVGYQQLTKHKKATAQESISIDAIRNVIIPIPPINEQMRIITVLYDLEKKIQTL